MSGWKNSDRLSRLPADWKKIRLRILHRDGYRCCATLGNGERCKLRANQVDHIIPNDDDSDNNLQSLCELHHRAKSSGEGAAAYHAQMARNRKRMRRQERHPGLL